MNKRFTGKTILITGGNSGIGFATAQRIINEGGKVIITGRNQKSLSKAEQELGANAMAIQSDVGSVKEIDKLMATIKEKTGKLDGLFANAGVAMFIPIDQVTEQDFDQMFNINVKGVYFTLQKAIPLLTDGSAIVITASVAASSGRSTASVYSASKAAVRSMARTFSASYVSRGIRVNVVSPGPIETPIWDRASGLPSEAVEATKKAIKESNPMKRFGTVEEVAAAVAFFLSSESSYILGEELLVDGGFKQL